eukprot:120182-Pleurochrysis_carterae.AAC.2
MKMFPWCRLSFRLQIARTARPLSTGSAPSPSATTSARTHVRGAAAPRCDCARARCTLQLDHTGNQCRTQLRLALSARCDTSTDHCALRYGHSFKFRILAIR